MASSLGPAEWQRNPGGRRRRLAWTAAFTPTKHRWGETADTLSLVRCPTYSLPCLFGGWLVSRFSLPPGLRQHLRVDVRASDAESELVLGDFGGGGGEAAV